MKTSIHSLIKYGYVLLLVTSHFVIVMGEHEHSWCEDSDHYFDVEIKGKTYSKNCKWVSQTSAGKGSSKKSNQYTKCNYIGVKENCPRSCNHCSCLNNQAKFTVKNALWNGSKEKGCDWVERMPVKRCREDYEGSVENCPLYCGECDDFPSAAPSMSPVDCQDSVTHTFGSFDWKGSTVTRDCAWLTKNSKPEIYQRRIANWCPTHYDGVLVQEMCPLSCGKCTLSSSAPSVRPTIHPSHCQDSVTHTFGSFDWKGSTVTRDCAWLTKNSKLEIYQRRIANWCPTRYDGVLVQNKCPITCGLCDIPSSAPSESPSTQLTISPSSALTHTVSEAPSEAFVHNPPKECENSVTYTFGTLPWEGSVITRDCTWLTSGEQSEIENWCPTVYDGVLVQVMCPLSCGLCDVPSSAPSESPSTQPTISPSSASSSAPSESPLTQTTISPSSAPINAPFESPSAQLTNSPSSTPTLFSCEDSATFSFDVVHITQSVTCAWFSAGHHPWKNQRRIKSRCSQRFDGVLVQDMCPHSCGLCDSHTQRSTCKDSESFSFGPLERKTSANCTWFTATHHHHKNQNRIRNWCPTVHDGVLVQNMCPFSCGLCDHTSNSH